MLQELGGNSLRKKINRKVLRRIQGRFLLRIIQGYKTVSYDALFIISDLPPIDLVILNDLEAKLHILNSRLFNTLDGKVPILYLTHPSSIKTLTIANYSPEDLK